LEDVINTGEIINQMPRRSIGIRGYVGELVVEQYLLSKYPPSKNYKIIKEMIPSESSRKGGGYLDLAVLLDNKVIEIYEVKTQDFIFGKSFKINPSLAHLWNNSKELHRFCDSEGNNYDSSKNFQAFLVLLVAPNFEALKNMGIQNVKNMILFEELKLDNFLDIGKIKSLFGEDLREELIDIKNPKNGKQTKNYLWKLRNKLQ